MDVSGGELVLERECTSKCHSRQHAAMLLSCVTKGSSSEIRSYCNWLCHNFGLVTDDLGRNLLHVAASTGKWEVVEWLIGRCHCNIDVRDAESGWTALHRSFYYGQIAVALTLLNHGANLRMTDREGLTPLDLLVEDRLPFVEYNVTYPQDVYVWGSNTNFNLGVGNEQSRAHPEILDAFHRENSNIKQVVMCKFHTVFLSASGRILTCGHGHGGRLGQGSEVTELTPSPVCGLGEAVCEMIAAGQDHLLLLMRGGQVWSCGLNRYHQLGHNPPPERLVKPKPLSLKFLKGKEVLGVCAARFHSVFYTKDSIYTFGLNAGQLGHPKTLHTQVLPHQVSGVYNEDWDITHVAASDGATVCATNRGDVFVLHEFQHRKIASRQLEIRKLSVIGGNLVSSCEATCIREGGGLELRVLLLTQSGKLYLWRQSNPYLRRCLFTTARQLIISDVHLSHNFVSMVTQNNQGYLGTIVPFKERKTSVNSPTSVKPQRVGSQLNQFLDRDDCDFIRAKRLPHIHRATSITSDSKGRNFAVLQNSPKIGLVEFPVVSESCMVKDFQQFLEEARLNDCVHDLIVQVGQKEYAVHKYILASRSEYFKKQITSLESPPLEKAKLVLGNVVQEAFEQILNYLYSGTCDFLIEGKEIRWVVGSQSSSDHIHENENEICKSASRKKKNKKCIKDERLEPVKCIQQLCKRLNVHSLSKKLETVQLVHGKIHIPYKSDTPSELKFDKNKFPCFYDVYLRSNDGTDFPCHKCVLVARSGYFRSMLGSSCWIEKTCLESLFLPISSNIMGVLLQYFYTDTKNLYDIEDPEFLCHILAVADQLLIIRLKEMCEAALVSLLTLKNAAELLQLAHIYNAEQLKRSSMQFICINISSIIEAKSLDVISEEVMEELSKTYRILVPSMNRRIITPNPNFPYKDQLQTIESCFPIDQDSDLLRQKPDPFSTKSGEIKMKSRRRTKSQNLELKESAEERKHRCDSESSEKDITLDIIAVEECLSAKKSVSVSEMQKENVRTSQSENRLTAKKPGQWTLTCPKLDDMLSLDKIMEEERKMSVLKKPSNFSSESKRLPHLSQKQKKLLAAARNNDPLQLSTVATGNLFSPDKEPKSPPVCPWAKINETASPIPCVWNIRTKDEICSENRNGLSSSPVSREPLSISLQAIQKAEEEEQHQALKPKIKSLHLINIEDQAIEELLILYRADGNPEERVTVSRVLPERIARPIWKKNATVPLLTS